MVTITKTRGRTITVKIRQIKFKPKEANPSMLESKDYLRRGRSSAGILDNKTIPTMKTQDN